MTIVFDSSIHQAIVQQMAEGVIVLDAQDAIRIVNPAAERIRKVRAERVVGRSIYAIHNPRQHAGIRQLIDSLKSGQVPEIKRIIQVREQFFENSYTALRDAAGNYAGTLLISRDVTEARRLYRENAVLRQTPTEREQKCLVVESAGARRVMEMARAIAPLDSTVLITGENGTGKECVVELIHQHSPRCGEALIRVNCAALPDTLVESELFGHRRGAFTDAVENRKGKFELAHGGTLFLDEIGDVSLPMQAKLLRAIQEKRIQPLGSQEEIYTNVRIVAATNRNLEQEVAAGRFRADLFYRLNVLHIEVPPLRERPEDILPMAETFLAHFSHKMNRPLRVLTPEARQLLRDFDWPGNVRQLRHAMERAVAFSKGAQILPADLPPELCPALAASPGRSATDERLSQVLQDCERQHIAQLLQRHGYRRQETAAALGISRKSLWQKIQRYELDLLDVTQK
ncbi:MAG: sigma-54 interaction domain-containing protein [Desulfuromonas sp.]|jgi:PAS domain S-box-containing protein|nr:sigma 54-interacting transcriptional regulator [Desulfuromonas thiophila]MDD3802368.1 sigma 54-interacting transcriptional regulator [Desulfuromonas thiophila]MDY0397826.1 sigma 54-interacting transcriptional regulator [Desulfuromonas thiophila]